MYQRQTIECDDARRLVAEGAHLVDVRSPQEYAQGALQGAVNVPLQNLLAGIQQLEQDKPIILYCASGVRSRQAAQALSMYGHSAVHDLGDLHNCQ